MVIIISVSRSGSQRRPVCEKSNIGFKAVKPVTIAAASLLCLSVLKHPLNPFWQSHHWWHKASPVTTCSFQIWKAIPLYNDTWSMFGNPSFCSKQYPFSCPSPYCLRLPGHSWRLPGSCRKPSVKFWNEVIQDWKIGVSVDLWIWLIKAVYIRY